MNDTKCEQHATCTVHFFFKRCLLFFQLDADELETILVKDQATFPDSPLVWLKDLASIITLRLEKLPEPDPVLAGKPNSTASPTVSVLIGIGDPTSVPGIVFFTVADYPMCLLPEPVHALLAKTLTECSSHTRDLFLDHCVQSIVNDISKGLHILHWMYAPCNVWCKCLFL